MDQGFINKIEVHPYPPGTARTRPRKKGEPDDKYLAEKWKILKEATAERIKMVWKWESPNS